MNIAAILEENASVFGGRLAIVERGRRVTFAELDRAAAVTAGALAQAGLASGMRALVMSPMSIDLYATMVAIFRLGVTVVFVDPSAGTANLSACVARVRPDAFVAVPQAHLLRLTCREIRRIPVKVVIRGVSEILRSRPGGRSSIEPCNDSTPAIISFTTGTTGQPKAAVRTHGFLRAQHAAIVDNLQLRPAEVDLTTLPIFLLANLASGVTSIVPAADLKRPGSIDCGPVLEQIRIERPGRTVASPALLERLIEQFRRPESLPFKKVFTGGGPVFPATLDALAGAAREASIVAVYGSTEAEPIASVARDQIDPCDREAMLRGAGLLVGRPVSSVDVRILPDRWGQPLAQMEPAEFHSAVQPVGVAGEIVVAGDHVLPGYLDGVANDETKIPVGSRVWHRTGDAGYTDPGGRLWLLGRCSAKVSDSDGVLYPLAVECAASHVPGVRRSALVGHRGRRVLVIERDRETASAEHALRDRLAWAHLSEIVTIPQIPVDRRHNAKVDVPALHRILQAI